LRGLSQEGGNPTLSIVVPLCNEEGNVELLIRELREVMRSIAVPYEVILVDDGSRDRTWSLVREATERDEHVKGVSLSRNFGHQNAIFAGLYFASGDAVVTMDGDLQHPPSLLPELFKEWKNGNQVVETRRIESEDVSLFKKTTSRWFYRIFSFLSGLPMTEGTSDFRLMDRQVVDAVLQMQDAALFLRGIAYWVGFQRTTIPYQAQPRHAGRTKYGLLRMVRFATASMLSFSIVPLRLGIWLGVVTSGLAFIELIYILVSYLRGNVVPGWTSTLVVISFMFGILFILVGIIGAYIGNVLETVKNRPRFIVKERSGL
jgi:dolichol-phosphate mannosyltransferase